MPGTGSPFLSEREARSGASAPLSSTGTGRIDRDQVPASPSTRPMVVRSSPPGHGSPPASTNLELEGPRNVVAALVAVTAAVAAVALSRAARVGSPVPSESPVQAAVDRAAVAEHLACAIRFETVSVRDGAGDDAAFRGLHGDLRRTSIRSRTIVSGARKLARVLYSMNGPGPTERRPPHRGRFPPRKRRDMRREAVTAGGPAPGRWRCGSPRPGRLRTGPRRR